MYTTNNLQDAEQDEILAYVLHRISLLCRTRGINFKHCFRLFDKTSSGFARLMLSSCAETCERSGVCFARFRTGGCR